MSSFILQCSKLFLLSLLMIIQVSEQISKEKVPNIWFCFSMCFWRVVNVDRMNYDECLGGEVLIPLIACLVTIIEGFLSNYNFVG